MAGAASVAACAGGASLVDRLNQLCQGPLQGLSRDVVERKARSLGLRFVDDASSGTGAMDARQGYEGPMFVMVLGRARILAPGAVEAGACEVTLDDRGIIRSVEWVGPE